jgi:hypothetical protein
MEAKFTNEVCQLYTTPQGYDHKKPVVRKVQGGQESSRAGESHPHALTEPDVTLAAQPALRVQPPRTTGARGRTARAGGGPSVAASAPLVAGGPGDAGTSAAPIGAGATPGAGMSDPGPPWKTGGRRSSPPEHRVEPPGEVLQGFVPAGVEVPPPQLAPNVAGGVGTGRRAAVDAVLPLPRLRPPGPKCLAQAVEPCVRGSLADPPPCRRRPSFSAAATPANPWQTAALGPHSDRGPPEPRHPVRRGWPDEAAASTPRTDTASSGARAAGC